MTSAQHKCLVAKRRDHDDETGHEQGTHVEVIRKSRSSSPPEEPAGMTSKKGNNKAKSEDNVFYEHASSVFGSKRNISGNTQYSGSPSSNTGVAVTIRRTCARRMRLYAACSCSVNRAS